MSWSRILELKSEQVCAHLYPFGSVGPPQAVEEGNWMLFRARWCGTGMIVRRMQNVSTTWHVPCRTQIAEEVVCVTREPPAVGYKNGLGGSGSADVVMVVAEAEHARKLSGNGGFPRLRFGDGRRCKTEGQVLVKSMFRANRT